MHHYSPLIASLLLGALACGSGRKSGPASPMAGEAGIAGMAPTNSGGAGPESDGGAPTMTPPEAGAGGTAALTEGGATSGALGGEGSDPPKVSRYCGDAIRDPVTEACDDGPGDAVDSCSSACSTRNLLVVGGDGTANLSRRLGFGRHPVAVGDFGAAVVFTEIEGSVASLRLVRFNTFGQREGDSLLLSSGLTPGDGSNPVLAALPDGRYVAAWSDLSEGSLDVVLREITSEGVVGDAKLANSTSSGAQHDPDLLNVGANLVAAWTDGFAVKARTFSAELQPISEEQTLSSEMFAANVTLAAHAAGWAATFREPAAEGGEQLEVVLDHGMRFTIGPFEAGPAEDRPALLSLDADHLLLAFCENENGASRLQAAILSTDGSDELVTVPLQPTLAPYDADASLDQRRPGLTRIDDRIFLSWQTASPLGDVLGEELFVREVSWDVDAAGELVLSLEDSLVIDWPRVGAQQVPTLEAARFGQDNVLVSVFEHAELLPDSKVAPDLVFGYLPWPLAAGSMPSEGL